WGAIPNHSATAERLRFIARGYTDVTPGELPGPPRTRLNPLCRRNFARCDSSGSAVDSGLEVASDWCLLEIIHDPAPYSAAVLNPPYSRAVPAGGRGRGGPLEGRQASASRHHLRGGRVPDREDTPRVRAGTTRQGLSRQLRLRRPEVAPHIARHRGAQ